MRFGFDVHGVIDTKPKLYSKLTKRLISLGHEVHIITGGMDSKGLRSKLKSSGIEWTHLFSIPDYHSSIGNDVEYTASGNTWMDAVEWDKTKGEYCDRHNIDLHIDDTERYSKYFKDTVYLLVGNK